MQERNSYTINSMPAFGDVGDRMLMVGDNLADLNDVACMPLRRSAYMLALLKIAAQRWMLDWETDCNENPSAEESELHRFALSIEALADAVGQAIEEVQRCLSDYAETVGRGPVVNLKAEDGHWPEVEELVTAMKEADTADSVSYTRLIVAAALDLLFAQAEPLAAVAKYSIGPAIAERPALLRRCVSDAREGRVAKRWPYAWLRDEDIAAVVGESATRGDSSSEEADEEPECEAGEEARAAVEAAA